MLHKLICFIFWPFYHHVPLPVDKFIFLILSLLVSILMMSSFQLTDLSSPNHCVSGRRPVRHMVRIQCSLYLNSDGLK